MSKHSKEPWKIGQDLGMIDIIDSEGDIILILPNYTKDYDKAQRIVQCVNAMAGIEDPEGFLRVIIAEIGPYLSSALDDEKCGQDFKDKIKAHFNSMSAVVTDRYLFPTESEES